MFNQPVHSARELLVRYHTGAHDFKGAYLEGEQLKGACLAGVNLCDLNHKLSSFCTLCFQTASRGDSC